MSDDLKRVEELYLQFTTWLANRDSAPPLELPLADAAIVQKEARRRHAKAMRARHDVQNALRGAREAEYVAEHEAQRADVLLLRSSADCPEYDFLVRAGDDVPRDPAGNPMGA